MSDKVKEPKAPTLLDGITAQFHVPSKKEIDGLRVGDYAKVEAFAGKGSERFWVELQEIDGAHETFTGRVDNDLVLRSHNIKVNDLITFKGRNILATLKGN